MAHLEEWQRHQGLLIEHDKRSTTGFQLFCKVFAAEAYDRAKQEHRLTCEECMDPGTFYYVYHPELVQAHKNSVEFRFIRVIP